MNQPWGLYIIAGLVGMMLFGASMVQAQSTLDLRVTEEGETVPYFVMKDGKLVMVPYPKGRIKVLPNETVELILPKEKIKEFTNENLNGLTSMSIILTHEQILNLWIGSIEND